MRSITRSKDQDSILESLEKYSAVFIIGCGTCATMCRTGGVTEVLNMVQALKQNGKNVVGWTVIPTTCDILSHEIIKQEQDKIDKAEAVLEMTCGFGNQQIGAGCGIAVIPANDTISIGREFPEGNYTSACMQCGECLLGSTASICPMVLCPKSLGNGPCGGTDNGKCEVDKNKDCAWTLIYNRLEAQGRLDVLREYQPPKNYQKALEPVLYSLEEEKE
ncbi:MAG TPA: 5,10-methylenetetrahydrofolate reductase [Spirochaetes bacterium]|nr:5,10-methylenetetrahydrofolate reductase [Spirochaetota bacterium]